MKKYVFLITLFVAYSIFINSCPVVTQWDRNFIVFVQALLKDLPTIIPLLPDFSLYSIMIAIPLIFGTVYFFKKKLYPEIFCILSVPLVTFLLNCIVKPLIHRERPPYELQIAVHPDSFSYVSSHSLVTACVWAMVCFFIFKYSKNVIARRIALFVALIWTLFVGFSRVWLGVHNPTDVLGAYILASILVLTYIDLLNFFNTKIKPD